MTGLMLEEEEEEEGDRGGVDRREGEWNTLFLTCCWNKRRYLLLRLSEIVEVAPVVASEQHVKDDNKQLIFNKTGRKSIFQYETTK